MFTEIVSKYRDRLAALEESIKKILQEEWEERALLRTENQVNRVEKLLKGTKEENSHQRLWFQSDKERRIEKGM